MGLVITGKGLNRAGWHQLYQTKSRSKLVVTLRSYKFIIDRYHEGANNGKLEPFTPSF
ncbi:hypothetical protein SAMN05444008_105160 [Cnuella takakiae]|uniref:Uncharacterized protein n=1 Tax=Cnuella takakiae TaxID=1302690 RepID=A0A1M4ZBX3_9BACT|nr:hypothetical protein SAMN05444008_105160 [Cnuella takakiae]